MSKKGQYIFVLWGHKFDEIAATIFTCQLRRDGLRVKLVGLDSQRTIGSHGLGLIPDLTLGRALHLANKASCIVIPCGTTSIKPLANDPRVCGFFAQAQANNARFITSKADQFDTREWNTLSISEAAVLVYPENEELFGYIRGIVGILSD